MRPQRPIFLNYPPFVHTSQTGRYGSSLATVDDFLDKRGIEHSLTASSKTVYAIVKKLKGGSIFASKSLSFQFHFDDSMKLQSIDAKASYTGP